MNTLVALPDLSTWGDQNALNDFSWQKQKTNKQIKNWSPAVDLCVQSALCRCVWMSLAWILIWNRDINRESYSTEFIKNCFKGKRLKPEQKKERHNNLILRRKAESVPDTLTWATICGPTGLAKGLMPDLSKFILGISVMWFLGFSLWRNFFFGGGGGGGWKLCHNS